MFGKQGSQDSAPRRAEGAGLASDLMSRSRFAALAGVLLTVGSLAWALSPGEPAEIAVKGATVLFDPSEIFRPGLANASRLRTQELESVKVRPDDRTVDLQFLGGNSQCWSLDQVRAKFELERIQLGLYGGYHKLPEGAVCNLDGRKYPLTISLDQPVRARHIEAAAPVIRGGVVEEDPKGILRPGRVSADRTHAVEVQSVKVARGGQSVAVKFMGGNSNCWSVDQVVFRFETARILLGIYGGYHAPPGTTGGKYRVSCTLEGLFYELTFRLDERVAGRPIEPVEYLSKPL